MNNYIKDDNSKELLSSFFLSLNNNLSGRNYRNNDP